MPKVVYVKLNESNCDMDSIYLIDFASSRCCSVDELTEKCE